jgi:hypothetical protein
MSKLTRTDLQHLARLRLREAGLLLDGASFSGSYYFTGLAVECALKACIARATAEFDFPDFDKVKDSWHHDLNRLLSTAGLSDQLSTKMRGDEQFKANWLTVKDWKIDSRYEQWPEEQARNIYNAVNDKRSRNHAVDRGTLVMPYVATLTAADLDFGKRITETQDCKVLI